jgi:prepilin-type N-terminal cleavage/methylation domain-containing protein
MMRRQTGFTLIELMVVIAILGILGASAMPLYRTVQQRTYGAEASLMMKKLLDGQILYYLEKNEFFPKEGETIIIPPDNPPNAQTSNYLQAMQEAIKITVPVGHFLDYLIRNYGTECSVIISADFPLFQDGSRQLIGKVDKEGKTLIITGG